MRRTFLRAAIGALCAVLASAADYPQRIVSLSPDLTEILYGVGAFNRVVAVSNFDTYPPETARLPHLGSLDTLSLERLTAVKPDLVVMNDVQAPFLEQPLKDLGLRIFKTSNQSIQQTFAAMTAIGRVTGRQHEADALVTATRAGLDRVSRRMVDIAKPSVVLIVDRTPGTLRELYTATDGSYLAELVAIAGGRIGVPADAHGYRRLGKEDLVAIDPDIILDFMQAVKGRFAGNPMDAWQEMPELKAVRTHRVYEVNEDFVPHASQRMVQTAELFAKRIHPEIK
jgi:ABC-type Fe3+-hydroxamate transport system substrate-binding protein